MNWLDKAGKVGYCFSGADKSDQRPPLSAGICNSALVCHPRNNLQNDRPVMLFSEIDREGPPWASAE
jgi:hypothetical protein